jgi:Domain of unknown function (DUF4129)
VIQAVQSALPASAVHDSVQSILAGAAYRRTLSTTILERLLLWLGEGLGTLIRAMRGVPGGRAIAIAVAVLLVALVVARLFIAAQARDGEGVSFGSRGGVSRREDPWRAAERLAATGDFEGAAHQLYRGVLASLQQGERLRLDPSHTSGDYTRELRARGSGALNPFRAFARRFDVAVYGHGVCDAALYDDLRRLADPLRQRARAA